MAKGVSPYHVHLYYVRIYYLYQCVVEGDFFYCFLVRPEGIKNTEELVDGDRFDPFSFIVSILPKSIISSSVWKMAFLCCFSVRPKGIKEAQGLVSEISLDTVLFITSMPKSIISVVVWSSVIFFIVFWFAQKE